MIVRPRVRWSRRIIRSATHNGLWYGSDIAPVPNLMRLVCAATYPMKISGDEIHSVPAE